MSPTWRHTCMLKQLQVLKAKENWMQRARMNPWYLLPLYAFSLPFCNYSFLGSMLWSDGGWRAHLCLIFRRFCTSHRHHPKAGSYSATACAAGHTVKDSEEGASLPWEEAGGSAPVPALCSEVNVARHEIAHGFVGTTDGIPRWPQTWKEHDLENWRLSRSH